MNVDVQAQIEEWRKQLLDLSNRNRLINCKVGPRAAIEIEHPTSSSIWSQIVGSQGSMTFVWKRDLLGDDADAEVEQPQLALFSGEDESAQPRDRTGRIGLEGLTASPTLALDHLLTPMADAALGARLNRLALNAKTSVAEQGVNILYMAFGLLRWFESPDSQIQLSAPILLVPVQLFRSAPESPWMIRLYEDEVVLNECLYQRLHADFELELPRPGDDELESDDARLSFIDRLRKAVRGGRQYARWEVEDRIIVGVFSFQKLAMWEDLGKNKGDIATHSICRAIAGDQLVDGQAQSQLLAPDEFDDKIDPKSLNSILDCDSSQLEAILAVKQGMNLVLDGPPGTGKSQTIANLIAETVASNKSVLFVSEKAAALEVVKRRLDDCQLGDFCLECHSHKANKKDVIAELGRSLDLPQETYRDQSETLESLRRDRERLNAYVRALHKKTGSLDVTPFKCPASDGTGMLSRLG